MTDIVPIYILVLSSFRRHILPSCHKMKPVVLILGAGSNIGASVAKKFAANGYLVAVSARGLRDGSSPEGYLSIQADLADKSAVPRVFETVKSAIGIPPSVVIYNGMLLNPGLKQIQRLLIKI